LASEVAESAFGSGESTSRAGESTFAVDLALRDGGLTLCGGGSVG
jgi:hypothetical protein